MSPLKVERLGRRGGKRPYAVTVADERLRFHYIADAHLFAGGRIDRAEAIERGAKSEKSA